jgi:hypothetical protein
MASDEHPTRADRDAARETVRAAFATGRIVEADHDLRLKSIDNARTGAEIDAVVHGLAPGVPPTWREYDVADPAQRISEPEEPADHQAQAPRAAPGRPEPRAYQPYPAAGAQRRPRPGPRVGLAVGVGVAALMAGGAAAIFAAAGGGDGFGPISPDVHSQEGIDALAEDLRDETGSSLVFDANLYPGYAVVNVPAKEGTTRADGYYWDGGLDDWTKGNSDKEAFDLAEIDGSLLDDMCATVEALVEAPDDCYILVSKPAPGSAGAWFSAYVSNDYSETAWVGFALEGDEVERHPPAG